ncbi:hypothetical protein PILCRDRAFT_575896 [Piloderma croceum F 1598]|uniref:Uncharacterized protein n=1 Tax=Piloderma croceum (strain F 1598) TaxID=765440 RepID=A0A0C3BNC2_PILCF|nr:hypothetical protein PILCRDRAFT_575896 [Piloderma croceum F 1598]
MSSTILGCQADGRNKIRHGSPLISPLLISAWSRSITEYSGQKKCSGANSDYWYTKADCIEALISDI